MSLLSLIISLLALALSALTAWLTLIRRGTVRMTKPTVIYFGPDGNREQRYGKVFLRTLLYASSTRGRIVESMHVRLRRGESTQTFNVWVYGDRELSRGSGLFVGQNGVTANHHFLPPLDGDTFVFTAGEYALDVFASLVGSAQTLQLFSTILTVTPEMAAALQEEVNGLYFDWGPESSRYYAHIRPRPRLELPPFLRDLAG